MSTSTTGCDAPEFADHQPVHVDDAAQCAHSLANSVALQQALWAMQRYIMIPISVARFLWLLLNYRLA